jgi:hypothetical protein
MKTFAQIMKEITYPMSLKYCPDWGLWEVLRELRSNAEDTRTKVNMYLTDDGDMIITDEGEGLAIRQLLFGVSEKSVDNAIGQFGEGLKLALLVLTRLSMLCDIYSGKYHITNDSAFIEEVEVLKLKYEEVAQPYAGTKVIIHGWSGDTYEDRFMFDNDDPRILTTVTSGSLVDTENPVLMVKGVFVSYIPKYEFSYDFHNVNMNRDRKTVSENEIQNAVGNLWSEIDDAGAWKILFSSSSSGKYEKNMSLGYYLNDKTKEAILKGWRNAFGSNAVLGLDEKMSREAEHLGAKVVRADKFGYNMVNSLAYIVKTDDGWVKDHKPTTFKKVTKLTPEQRAIVTIYKRMIKKTECTYGFDICDLPDKRSICDHQNAIIHIHVDNLNNGRQWAVQDMIHELAHAIYKTSDTTDEHVLACSLIGATLYL